MRPYYKTELDELFSFYMKGVLSRGGVEYMFRVYIVENGAEPGVREYVRELSDLLEGDF